MSHGKNREERAIFFALSTLVGLLLLVCCANVATLLLVRGTERAGTLAVQAALGASRGRITLQLFLESLLIAAGGGVVGLLAGFAMLRWMQLNLSAHWGYYWMAMELRPPVLAGTLALVVVAALLAGTLPAIRAGRVNVAALLVAQGRGRGGPRERRIGRWLIGAQVALSTLGMIAAVYLAAEFAAMARVTDRLPLERVALARVTLPADAYADPGERAELVERLRGGLAGIPGVTAVSVSAGAPGGAVAAAAVRLPGDAADSPTRRVPWLAADEHFPTVYAMRVVAGTAPGGATGALPGVLVTTGFAARHFDGPPLGQRLRVEGVHGVGVWAEVTGVVEDWFPDRRGVASERVIVPLTDAWSDRLFVSLATHDGAAAVLGGMRGVVQGIDPRLPVEDVQSLGDRMRWFLRMNLVIAGVGVLGGVGSAAVAAIGLYGVMSYQVRARRRELGVRMAVGAGTRRIVYEVVRESVLRVAPGLAVGAALALTTVPILSSRAGPASGGAVGLPLPIVCALAAVFLLAVGVVAALEPAWRAARVDPQEVLRGD